MGLNIGNPLLVRSDCLFWRAYRIADHVEALPHAAMLVRHHHDASSQMFASLDPGATVGPALLHKLACSAPLFIDMVIADMVDGFPK
jgi:hypothetical protein